MSDSIEFRNLFNMWNGEECFESDEALTSALVSHSILQQDQQFNQQQQQQLLQLLQPRDKQQQQPIEEQQQRQQEILQLLKANDKQQQHELQEISYLEQLLQIQRDQDLKSRLIRLNHDLIALLGITNLLVLDEAPKAAQMVKCANKSLQKILDFLLIKEASKEQSHVEKVIAELREQFQKDFTRRINKK